MVVVSTAAFVLSLTLTHRVHDEGEEEKGEVELACAPQRRPSLKKKFSKSSKLQWNPNPKLFKMTTHSKDTEKSKKNERSEREVCCDDKQKQGKQRTVDTEISKMNEKSEIVVQ